MADGSSNNEVRAWLRAQGHTVPGRGRVRADLAEIYYAEFPEARPAGSVALLPSPDEAWADDSDVDVLGLLEPDSDREAPERPARYEAVPDEPEALTADPGPAHGRREWRKTAKEAPRGGRAPSAAKITAAIHKDIHAKISVGLEIPGRVWQARDPLCGGTFVEQRPAIADALTGIVCDSPDLVAWFTGPGGKFMKWLDLMMAVAPVAMVVGAHHVFHTVDDVDAQQPDYGQYAA
jgi:hypothetical protein